MRRSGARGRLAPLTVALTWCLRTDWNCAALLTRAARHAAAAEGFHTGSLSIAVVGARRMAALHERFLQQPGPTDVITFDFNLGGRARGELNGEVVVCADVARRRASGRARRAAVRELALYVVHGVLHLTGYDDHDPRDFARMHAREDKLLARLGFGRVFSGEERRGKVGTREGGKGKAGRRPARPGRHPAR